VVQDANTVLAKELIGQTVYASDKTKIGSISDLILSKDAKTVAGRCVCGIVVCAMPAGTPSINVRTLAPVLSNMVNLRNLTGGSLGTRNEGLTPAEMKGCP